MMPATCVPWPKSSRARALGRSVKSTLATTRPRSARCGATPESITATPMPRPVKPRQPASPLHTWSAPVDSVVTAIIRAHRHVARTLRRPSGSSLSASSCPPVTSSTAPPRTLFFTLTP